MFEQFQAQQKKARDEERKKKTEAAAALQGYRKTDLSSEEMKLAALREEERQRKAEAAALLQQYRQAGLSEVEAKKAADKQEEIRRRQQTDERLRSTNEVVKAHDPVTVHSSLQMMENSGAVSAMAAQFSVAPEGRSPVKAEAEQVGGVPTATSVEPKNEDTTSTPVTSTINFMFGLIMPAADEPVPGGYLTKADQIARNILSTSCTKVSTVSYPKVLSITKDDAKSNFETTNRFLVTVGIDFESPDDDDANQFNKAVINEIRNAISAGTFTRE